WGPRFAPRVPPARDVPGPASAAAPQVMTVRWAGPLAGAQDTAALAMLGEDLFGGPAARERRSLVDKWRAALAVAGGLGFPATWSAYRAPGQFACRVWFRPGVSPTLVRELVFRQIHEIEVNGIAPDELRRAEIWTAADWLRRGQTAAARARRLARAEWDTGSPAAANQALRPMLDVTAAQTQAAAPQYLRDAQARITVQPCTAAGPEACRPPGLDGARMPAGGAVSWPVVVAWRPPAPDFDGQFQNGLRLIVVHDANMPLVTVQLSVRTGDAAEYRWRRVLARVLPAGTARESGTALAQRFQAIGGTLWVHAGRRRFTLGASALAPYAGILMRRLAAVALRPALPAAALARAARNGAAWRAGRESDPRWLARREAARLSQSGQAVPRAALDRASLLALAHRILMPNNDARLVVVGDVDPAWVQSVAAQYFVDPWPFGNPPASRAKPPAGRGRMLLVSAPGGGASFAFVTAPAPAPGTADYAAWRIAMRLAGGPAAVVPTAQLPAALGAAFVRRAQLAAAPPPAAQVEALRARMMTQWMARWQTQEQIAWAWTRGGAGTVLAALAAVTPAAVQRAARQYLAPRLTVVAGDAAALKVPLSHLTHGSITILNAQGGMIGSYPPEGPAGGTRRVIQPPRR
ncbi:MAG: hypothetical protein ACRD13_14135, partial [Terriglobales bacterium]